MSKIATFKQLEVKDIMRVLKRKVLEGEINIKYDESEDIIETFDLDPGLKERVKKTKDLYEKILEGNKNMFLNIKTKKLDQIMAVYLVNMKGLGFSPLDLGGVFWPLLQSSFLPPLI